MERLSIKDIQNYCFCPEYYRIKKESNIELVNERYEKTLMDAMYCFLKQMQQEGKCPSCNVLKEKWGKEWIKVKTTPDICLTVSASKRDCYDNKRRMGIDTIMNFHEMINKEEQYPICVNIPYELNTKSTILSGDLEYIREIYDENGSGHIQLVKFRIDSNRFQTAEEWHHSIDLTAAAMGFEKLFGKKDIELVILDVYNKKVIKTTRTEEDIVSFRKTASIVSKCISNGVFYKSPDKKCFHCKYRKQCFK